MSTAGLCKRVLPSPPAIDFSFSEGKKLFKEALDSGTMEGPWRWFDESMSDCCEPLEKVKDKGISFGQLVCLAHCAGANIEAFRSNQSSVDEFRKSVLLCSTSEDCHVISSYHRGTFNQTGTGHFSPIGGYHAGTDMALILDVARFKYPPHWVPLTLLWKAMDTVVQATGLHRGFMVVSRRQTEPSLLYSLSCKHESSVCTARYLMDDVPVMLGSDTVNGVKHIISTIFTSIPLDFDEFVKWVAEFCRQADPDEFKSQEEKGRLSNKDDILKQVQETGLYKLVADVVSSEKNVCENKMIIDNEDGNDIAESVCCQGAGFLGGKAGMSNRFCSWETDVRCYKANGDEVVRGVSGSCGYSGMHPASSDVLSLMTALLLALPPQTWAGIKDNDALQEMSSLVSLEGLPPLLTEEILHLRVQLLLPKRCADNKVEDDLAAVPI